MKYARDTILFCLLICGLCGCGDDDSPQSPSVRTQYLHVATNGSSAADGSSDTPLFYPNRAMEKAFLEGYRGVKFAAGDYQLYLSEIELRFYGGIDIIGGCDPQTWEPVTGQYSLFYAVRGAIPILGVRVPTLIRGLEIYGNMGGSYELSSSALYISGCGPELRFEQCRFIARSGGYSFGGGRDGGQPGPGLAPLNGGLGSCNENVTVAGGENGLGGCWGGHGGDGGLPGQPGQDGGYPCGTYGDNLAVGGMPGQDGQDGPSGDDGEDGANGKSQPGLGQLLSGNIEPFGTQWGDMGKNGRGGFGGGGGGGSINGTGNGGGGGGYGGGGGGSGVGGPSGGHSIAVLCDNSNVIFHQCTFRGAQGGRGGNGGNGALGVTGSPGAAGGDACLEEIGRGGHGGTGGHGGAGGGGAGGNGGASYGLLILGEILPDWGDECVFASDTSDTTGTGGIGGLNGNGQTRADDGFAGEKLGLKIIDVPEKALIFN